MAIAKIGVLLVLGILFSCGSSSNNKTQDYFLKDSIQTKSLDKQTIVSTSPSTRDEKNATIHFNKRKKKQLWDDYKFIDCKYLNTYSAKQRKEIYPFNKATRVELVFFFEITPIDSTAPPLEPNVVTIDAYQSVSYNDSSKTIQLPVIEKRIALSEDKINKLTDILYNYSEPTIIETGLCYEPRHAILFYKDGNTPFAAIEICFHCMGIKTFPEGTIPMMSFCDKKWILMEEFFHQAGISYGLPSYEKK